VGAGVVSFAGVKDGYGYTIEVTHGDGYVTRYAHNSRLTVRVGDMVTRGQQVARMGSTGRSTGTHLHFEVLRNGVPVNPLGYIGG
jgi:murein DD-endopeptidase MepM/ murein hydrolase activator NlpD